ncbi:MAG: c-type cytochrome [Burkholderiales bacterium]
MKIISALATLSFSTHLLAWGSLTQPAASQGEPLVIAAADSSAKDKAAVCIACHGEDGNSPSGAFPILAGQTSRYLYLQLKDYKEGRRKDPVMAAMAANLSKEDMRALADYFASRKPKSTNFNADAAKAAKGKAVADAALCTMCHLGGFSGQNEIPRVGGQHYEYVVKQLKDFRARNRTNDAGNMTSVSRGLSDEDIENLAHYIAGLN